jgi:hypothetical protein
MPSRQAAGRAVTAASRTSCFPRAGQEDRARPEAAARAGRSRPEAQRAEERAARSRPAAPQATAAPPVRAAAPLRPATTAYANQARIARTALLIAFAPQTPPACLPALPVPGPASARATDSARQAPARPIGATAREPTAALRSAILAKAARAAVAPPEPQTRWPVCEARAGSRAPAPRTRTARPTLMPRAPARCATMAA